MVDLDAVEFELRESCDLPIDQFADEHKHPVEDPVLRDGKSIGVFDLDIGLDAVASVDGAAEVGLFLFGMFGAASGVALRIAASVVLKERSVRVVALNQPSARRVVLRDGQGQGAARLQREDALDESLAEARLADDQTAIVILDGAGDDL